MERRSPPSATTKLGSYEILFGLARGGMAELLLARIATPGTDEKLVVLKKILPDYVTHPRFVNLFLDEARLVGALDHPNIAKLYDQGVIDDNHFFAMEYVHGKDVRSTLQRTVLRKQKFPLGPAVYLTRAVASALHYAHERKQPDGASLGIVHRDVSPSNILISYEGDVKLVDFGVAKAASSSVKTQTGMLKGKISYMSPEQAKGSSIDRRSDVFSLGIVLWEAIAMRRLFLADNDLATIQRVIHMRPPPPSQHRPDCPHRLDEIVGKALAADPDARYQTAAELEHDLEALARDEKMSQTAHSLRAYMHQAFEPEITAWREAQEAGTTLTDYIIATGLDRTVSIGDGDLESVNEFDPDDDDDPPTSLDMQAGTLEVPEGLDAHDLDSTARERQQRSDHEDPEDATTFYNGRPRPATAEPASLAPSEPPPVIVIPRAATHPSMGEVTSYPSIGSDPSYEKISRDAKGELSKSKHVRRFELRRIVLVAIAAIALGIAVAFLASC